VFVEKPLALHEKELAQIEELLASNKALQGKLLLMVGYNRRFSPLVRDMKAFFSQAAEPSMIHYYVNAGFLPKDHWTHDPVDGGGRIIGEVCHFIDTIQYLTGALPVRIHAESLTSESAAVTNEDNVTITMRMSDGSVGVITYASNGDTSMAKERIVMSNANSTAVMNNFSALELYRGGKKTLRKSPGDKGHRDEVTAFISAIKDKRSELIPYESLFATTRATFAVLDSLRWNDVVTL
jgi:polar amino acid transport system substrate-binding protein